MDRHLLAGRRIECLGHGAGGRCAPAGATGAAGADGATGPAGPTGPTGPNVTATSAYAASSRGDVVSVILGGTPVPLPDNQLLSPGITVNGANDTFTVNETGRYQISYKITTATPLIGGSRLMINGAPNNASDIAPSLSLNRFASDILVDLTAGDRISLQMYGIVAVATLLPKSVGASLSIVRLS